MDDFIFVLIELSSLGVTVKALQANIGWKSAFLKGFGPVSAKFSHSKGRPPQTIFLHRYIGQ